MKKSVLTLYEAKHLDNVLRVNQRALLQVSTKVRKGYFDKKVLVETQERQRAEIIRKIETFMEGKLVAQQNQLDGSAYR